MPKVSDLRTFAYDAITIPATATRLTLSNVDGISGQPRAEKVIIVVEVAQMRWRDDGTDPTSSEGVIANVGTIIVLDNRSRIYAWRGIRTGSTSAVIRVLYQG